MKDDWGLQRLVFLSAVLISAGLIPLLPSSPLVSLISSGSTTSSSSASQGGFGVVSTTTDATGVTESLLGLGLIGMGLVLEVLSLFTQVGGVAMPPDSPETKPS
jgi:hypothetical protein